MKLQQDPILIEGPSFLFTLKSLFRAIALAVNGKAEQTDLEALEARIQALENP